MDNQNSVPNVQRSLNLSLIDAFLYNLMVGAGETYLPAYALSIGMGEVYSGVVASLPLVSGAFLQLLTPKGLQKIGSHKSWVVLTAGFQSLAYLPLVYFTQTKAPDFWSLFIILTLYWASGFSAGPAWNYWMGYLVPGKSSAYYFSRRAKISQIGILIGLIGGGVALHNNLELGLFSSAFGLLFFFAFLCRVGSTLILSKQIYNREWIQKEHLLGLRDSWKYFLQDPTKKNFFIYLFIFQIAVYMTAPYVTPYLLAQVKMDYGAYMIAIALLLLGKILVLNWLQKKIDSLDPFRSLLIGVFWISPAPILWSLSDNYYYIGFLQFVSGMAWAFIEFGLMMIFFKDLNQKEKVPILTVYNLLNALAIIIGMIIGGRILLYLGEIEASYFKLFVLGGILRMICFIPLYRQNRRWSQVVAQVGLARDRQ